MISIAFKPLKIEHIHLLYKWMQQPHVHQWWGEGRSWSLSEIKEKYKPYTHGYKIQQGIKTPIHPFIIEFEKRPIGFIQFYRVSDFPRDGFSVENVWQEDKSLAAIDFYIGERDCIGIGLGTQALQSFLKDHVFKSFDACLVDPEKNNEAAIKAYAKAGFSPFRDLDSSIIMIARRKEIENNLTFQSRM